MVWRSLFPDELPRCRSACPTMPYLLRCRCSDSIEKDLFELELPDPALPLEEDFYKAVKWQDTTVVEEGRASCPINRLQRYVPLPIKLPGWCHGEDSELRLFPERYA